MPMVSVVIPTYKHRDFVLESIASVQAQTFTDWELIVVNDGSPDDTHELLQPLAEAGRIRYIRQENQGQSTARNRGLAEAAGVYLAFLDDDDIWPSDKLAWQVAELQQHPEYGIVAGTYRELGAGAEIFKPVDAPKTIRHEEMFTGCPCISPGQYLVRRELLEQIGGFDPNLWGTDDYDLLLRASRQTTVYLDKRLALFYRVHAGNASQDGLRMYRNTLKTYHKNLALVAPTERSRLRRRGYDMLYQYYGVPLFWIWHKELRRGHVVQALRVIGAILGMCGLLAWYYPRKLGWVVRDIIPGKLRWGRSHGEAKATT